MTEKTSCNERGIWIATILAIGIALAGFFISHGIIQNKSTRYVAVKGLSEINVEADVAFWPIQYSVSDSDLTVAYAAISEKEKTIRDFLKQQGIKDNEITVNSRQVKDRRLNLYSDRQALFSDRYIVTQTLMVRSSSPKKILAAVQSAGKLIEAGIALEAERWESRPTYLFTRLNDVKPKMIAEATQNARKSAEQFAKDAGSRLGSIKYANQGSFVILSRNPIDGVSEQQEIEKTVRVVSTIEYFLQ